MSAVPQPPLVPVHPEGIPETMRAAPRWAPWRAEWNPKKQKYGKIPHRADRPEYGLSNKSTKGWTTFDAAMAAYRAQPERFGGVGYLMTAQSDVLGIDLDHCRNPATGEVEPWAAELAARLDSYTEVSPSGTGLHIILAGHVAEDWLNHEQGVEVYSGNIERFLAITGDVVPGARRTVEPAKYAVLENMAARWRKRLTSAEVHDLKIPAVLPESELPDLAELELPPYALNFLSEGAGHGDRSGQLFAVAVAMAKAGLSREEVFSLLANNDHAMEIALDHRKQDYEKALRFLWKEAAQKGRARADGLHAELLDQFTTVEELEAQEATEEPLDDLVGTVESPPTGDEQDGERRRGVSVADDFDDLDAEEGGEGGGAGGGDADDPCGRDLAPVKAPKRRFNLMTPGQFLNRKPVEWLVRDLFPRAGLGVVFGDSGSGKSFFMLDVTMCVARGTDWRGRPVARGRVVYVVAEGATGFVKRFQAYCQHHGLDPADIDIHFLSDSFSLSTATDVSELLKALQALGRLDMVVIDTYARVMAGVNENDAKDVGEAVKQCEKLHRGTGALVVLVHHSGKDVNKGARGSGALRAAADVEIMVTKTSQYRAATITKMKDGADDAQYQFRLQEVELGRDDEGFPITSCVVEQRENQVRRTVPGKPLTPVQQLVLRTLDTSASLDDASALHFSTLKQLVVDALPRDPNKKKDNRHRDAGNAIESLVTSGELKQDDEGMVERAENNEV